MSIHLTAAFPTCHFLDSFISLSRVLLYLFDNMYPHTEKLHIVRFFSLFIKLLIVVKLIGIVYLVSVYSHFDLMFKSNAFVKRISWIWPNNTQVNPDVNLNLSEIITRAGYSVETHIVMTEDGYFLTLFRIPGSNGSLPVMLQHGLLCNSVIWTILGKGKALPYLLADQGYDVWLGNFRGSTYSTSHISLLPSELKFWNFSFNELGIYDLPAMITFITNMTSQPLHAYIGHSMGSTVFYVMATERPKIAQMVQMKISLAPTVFFNDIKSWLQYLAFLTEYEILMQFVFYKLLQINFLRSFLIYGCDQYIIREICINVLFVMFGYDHEQLNYTLLPVIFSHFPAGSSFNTILHYTQVFQSGKFRQYDYGRRKNLLIYNSVEPPDYDLANVMVPIALFFGPGDWLDDNVNVKRLYHTLPNVMDMYEVPWSNFSHADFIWAKDAPRLVYERIFQLLRRKMTNRCTDICNKDLKGPTVKLDHQRAKIYMQIIQREFVSPLFLPFIESFIVAMRLIVIVYLLSFCSYFDAADVTSEPSDLEEKILWASQNQSNNTEFNSDIILIAQMIRKAGYPAEVHIITTEDGYFLTLYRIPGGNDSLPVLLMHGFASSSVDWIVLGKGKALPYLLADEGYDVWLGNFRGNTFSRAHTSLSPSESKFWNFSLHEMGIYDLPAMITFITNVKSQPLYTYIGHSMGTSNFYIMASQRPEIARMVQMMISFGPGAFLDHMKSPLRYYLLWSNFENVTQFLFNDEILPHNDVMRSISEYCCDQNFTQREQCVNVLFWFCGYDREQFNYTLLPVILSYFPAGTSFKTMIHFAQVMKSGKFCQYNYGDMKNRLIYNSTEPPDYNLTNITIPIALFYSAGDMLTTPVDVKRLYNLLTNVLDLYEVPYPNFNHMDFLWAKDAPKLVYERVLKIMRRENLNNVTSVE
ncbi:uncharacterized protein [Anoplolepis gracilipes]|uniref:uncharacterized protein n=1 Tax=Anoplolepis gracilipes TaxID=354296 RepID=UPI003BA39FBA